MISVLHGGAFMRYRIGDMYRCLSAGGGALPRFIYLDGCPRSLILQVLPALPSPR